MAAELSPQVQNFPVVAERAMGRCCLGPALRRAASSPHVRLRHLGKGVLGQVAIPGLHARKSERKLSGDGLGICIEQKITFLWRSAKKDKEGHTDGGTKGRGENVFQDTSH